MIVVDASAWVGALVDAGATGAAARGALADLDWATPHHAPLEVLRTLHRLGRDGALSPDAADQLAAEVLAAPLRLPDDPTPLFAYAWQHRHNLSVYDAPYVGLAVRAGVPLVTLDLRLARAAHRLDAQVVVPGTPDWS